MPNLARSEHLVAKANDDVRPVLPGLAAARNVVSSRGWLSQMPSSFQRRVLDK